MQNAQINLPEYMEGLSAKVVDQTDGAQLLSSAVTGAHLDCRYTSAGETLLNNYLVIVLEDSSKQ